MLRTRYRTALAAACAAIALAGGTAHADPIGFFDPNTEGSVSDTQNVLGVVDSDLTATDFAIQAGCASHATKPAERPDTNSSTGRDIYSRVSIVCSGGTMSDTWKLQRHRWYGWQTLTSVSASNASAFSGDLATSCRAGTWSYRVEANNYHTTSYRTTCNNRNDVFFIDTQ
jgi:hypothetical protein